MTRHCEDIQNMGRTYGGKKSNGLGLFDAIRTRVKPEAAKDAPNPNQSCDATSNTSSDLSFQHGKDNTFDRIARAAPTTASAKPTEFNSTLWSSSDKQVSSSSESGLLFRSIGDCDNDKENNSCVEAAKERKRCVKPKAAKKPAKAKGSLLTRPRLPDRIFSDDTLNYKPEIVDIHDEDCSSSKDVFVSTCASPLSTSECAKSSKEQEPYLVTSTPILPAFSFRGHLRNTRRSSTDFILEKSSEPNSTEGNLACLGSKMQNLHIAADASTSDIKLCTSSDRDESSTANISVDLFASLSQKKENGSPEERLQTGSASFLSNRDSEFPGRRKTARVVFDEDVQVAGGDESENNEDSLLSLPRAGKNWRRTLRLNSIPELVIRASEGVETSGRATASEPAFPFPPGSIKKIKRGRKSVLQKLSLEESLTDSQCGAVRRQRPSARFSLACASERRSGQDLSDSQLEISVFLEEQAKDPLQSVLECCSRQEVVPFSDLYSADVLSKGRKVGEGSYGEVFQVPAAAASNSPLAPVLKVVPVNGEALVNGQPQTDFKQILAEIIALRELRQIVQEKRAINFLTMLGCFVTEGHYPATLLSLWDEYDNEKGSENDRPDENLLQPEQRFVVMLLDNGGRDLEKAELSTAAKAVSIFNQVVHSLAVAEHHLQFEHRDLHWGNILIKPTCEKHIEYRMGDKQLRVATEGTMATIIDFTLSRLWSRKDRRRLFYDLSEDPDIFKAEGDYQFEVYRMMRDEVKDDWEGFHPRTNIFWLHYLLKKLIEEVPYTGKKSSKPHQQAMRKLKAWEKNILTFASAEEFVLSET